MIRFRGNIYSIRTDRDGYSKVTLEIPQSDLESVLKLAKLTEQVLEIEVKAENRLA